MELGAHRKVCPFFTRKLKTVIFHTVHKSIFRHMYLWLEIDFIQVYCVGYYGTLNRRQSYVKRNSLNFITRAFDGPL